MNLFPEIGGQDCNCICDNKGILVSVMVPSDFKIEQKVELSLESNHLECQIHPNED